MKKGDIVVLICGIVMIVITAFGMRSINTKLEKINQKVEKLSK